MKPPRKSVFNKEIRNYIYRRISSSKATNKKKTVQKFSCETWPKQSKDFNLFNVETTHTISNPCQSVELHPRVPTEKKTFDEQKEQKSGRFKAIFLPITFFYVPSRVSVLNEIKK